MVDLGTGPTSPLGCHTGGPDIDLKTGQTPQSARKASDHFIAWSVDKQEVSVKPQFCESSSLQSDEHGKTLEQLVDHQNLA